MCVKLWSNNTVWPAGCSLPTPGLVANVVHTFYISKFMTTYHKFGNISSA